MDISHAPFDWLLQGEPYIQYRTRLDLLGESDDDLQVKTARKIMLEEAAIKGLIMELSQWPWSVISSHKSAGQPFHKLAFLADLGIKAEDPGMDGIVKHILASQSDEGPFTLPVNIPVHFGGSGQDQCAWALCDAPILVHSLARFGLQNQPTVQRAINFLSNLVRANGWPCAVSKELGKFRGPGRKDDPCPYATLIMLKALSDFDEFRNGAACHIGTEILLTLWKESNLQHPYMFYMGSDFQKLKAPLIWYDLLHVLDVLSRFPWVRADDRFREMFNMLCSKADNQGRYTPESIWTAWKEWEFGQKKVPSRWLTLLAWRIAARVNGVS